MSEVVGVTDPLEVYAQVMSEIGKGRPREEVLAAEGLDEESFAKIESAALRELSADGAGDWTEQGDVRLDRAFKKARGASGPPMMSLEDFAHAAAVAELGDKVHERFERLGIRLTEFLQASEHYTLLMTKDPELAERFKVALEQGRQKRR